MSGVLLQLAGPGQTLGCPADFSHLIPHETGLGWDAAAALGFFVGSEGEERAGEPWRMIPPSRIAGEMLFFDDVPPVSQKDPNWRNTYATGAKHFGAFESVGRFWPNAEAF